MKKNVVLLYILCCAACSNTSSVKKPVEGDSSATASPINTGETATTSGKLSAACNNLLLFKKGVSIESTTFTGDGKVIQKERSLITDVKNEQGQWIATVESKDITAGATADPLRYNCKCDGTTFYVDIAPLMGALDARGTRTDVKELAFPLNIRNGDMLPDAAVTVEMAMGEKSIKTRITYNHRKVEGMKNITTPAGTWNCYKIVAAIEMEMPGLDEKTKKMMDAAKDNMPSTHTVMWYAPETGIVQFDVYVDGELQGYSQITAIQQPGEASNNNTGSIQKLESVTYTNSRHIPGLEDWELREGNVVSELKEPVMILADVFKKGSRWVAFFSYKEDKNTEKYTIADVLEVKDVEQGWQLRSGLCRQNKKEDMNIVALVKTEDAEFMTNVKKAWRFNRTKKEFEEISIAGVDCRSEG